MPVEYEIAVDEIFALFKTAWDAETTAIVTYVPEVRYQGVEYPDAPDTTKYWARISQETVTEEQSTLRNDEDCIRYETDGLVFVQIFCPKSDSTSMEKGRKLATVAKKAFRGKKTSGGIWFRRARIKELKPEIKWNRLNVIAEYEYDEIG